MYKCTVDQEIFLVSMNHKNSMTQIPFVATSCGLSISTLHLSQLPAKSPSSYGTLFLLARFVESCTHRLHVPGVLEAACPATFGNWQPSWSPLFSTHRTFFSSPCQVTLPWPVQFEQNASPLSIKIKINCVQARYWVFLSGYLRPYMIVLDHISSTWIVTECKVRASHQYCTCICYTRWYGITKVIKNALHLTCMRKIRLELRNNFHGSKISWRQQ